MPTLPRHVTHPREQAHRRNKAFQFLRPRPVASVSHCSVVLCCEEQQEDEGNSLENEVCQCCLDVGGGTPITRQPHAHTSLHKSAQAGQSREILTHHTVSRDTHTHIHTHGPRKRHSSEVGAGTDSPFKGPVWKICLDL